ncbi:MAG: esterase-like activity of phytase family protein [Myxococcales bacterium]|nr:esterase-like activity of phytase family protein [Myxococcales bacterium]
MPDRGACRPPPSPAGSFTVNGPSDSSRSPPPASWCWSAASPWAWSATRCASYGIDLTGASNVLNVPALSAGKPFTPVSKRLILDFETLKDILGGIANLECLIFGPKLANGHDSLVVVADDNFPTADSATDRNQFLVFEVIP